MKESCKNCIRLNQCQLPNKSSASSKLKHGLSVGPRNTRPPGSTEQKHDPETWPRPDERNHQRQTNSAALPKCRLNIKRSLALATVANGVCEGSIIYASRRKSSGPTTAANRSGQQSSFTQPFQRRALAIKQHSTTLLKKRIIVGFNRRIIKSV